MIKERNYLFT